MVILGVAWPMRGGATSRTRFLMKAVVLGFGFELEATSRFLMTAALCFIPEILNSHVWIMCEYHVWIMCEGYV